MTTWPRKKTALGINEWFVDLPAFIALLDSVKKDHWWCIDMDLKYLNIRIDTRDNGFLLYLTGHAAAGVVEHINPDRVVKAIATWKEMS